VRVGARRRPERLAAFVSGDVRVKTLFLIFEAAFALLKAALFLPARILGYRPRPLGRRP
jgi:hypothetical protein